MEELQHLKQKLAESEAREKTLLHRVEELADFIENASMPLHWVNGSGIIIWANNAELELLGYAKEEYEGKHISHFHADQKAIADILVRLMNKETLHNYPARLLCKNGEIRHVLINSNVRWKEGKFIHTRCFTRDVSEIKKFEAFKAEQIALLEEKNRALVIENRSLKALLRPEKNT